MDAIRINGIEVVCILGERSDERVRPQRVLVDVALSADLSDAAMSDSLEDTVDYAALSNDIREALERAKCRLLERAADVVADMCLAYPRVEGVTVSVKKFGGVPGVQSAEVRIARTA